MSKSLTTLVTSLSLLFGASQISNAPTMPSTYHYKNFMLNGIDLEAIAEKSRQEELMKKPKTLFDEMVQILPQNKSRSSRKHFFHFFEFVDSEGNDIRVVASKSYVPRIIWYNTEDGPRGYRDGVRYKETLTMLDNTKKIYYWDGWTNTLRPGDMIWINGVNKDFSELNDGQKEWHTKDYQRLVEEASKHLNFNHK